MITCPHCGSTEVDYLGESFTPALDHWPSETYECWNCGEHFEAGDMREGDE